MILLIDAGNSRIKWGCLVGGMLQPGEAIAHHGEVTDIQVLSLAWVPLPRPERIIAVNVLGSDFGEALEAWVEETWGLAIEFVTAQANACGVVNAYHEPARLGADRWASLIAAHRLCDGTACVIDCGTALTIDVLAQDGEHLGGLIVPGLSLMRHALIERTAGIRPVAGLDPDPDTGVSLLARDTAGGVMGGTLYALVAAIDRIAEDIRATMATEVECLLTGGDAGMVRTLLTGVYRYEPDLVLKGLAVVAGDEA